MYTKPTPTTRFIELPSDDSSLSSGQITFTGTVYKTIEEGTEWEIVSKITTPFNTYPCSISTKTKLTLEDTYHLLRGASNVTTTMYAIKDT